MDFQIVATVVHLIGFALGLGGATVSDVLFFRAIRHGRITAADYGTLMTVSRVIWVGLGLLVLSGLTIFSLIYSEQGSVPMLASPRWQTKLTLVGVVLANGLVFKFRVLPFLRQSLHQSLSPQALRGRVWLLTITGTISALSWYSILIVTMLPRTFRPPYLYFMGAYLILLALGILTARFLLGLSLKKETEV